MDRKEIAMRLIIIYKILTGKFLVSLNENRSVCAHTHKMNAFLSNEDYVSSYSHQVQNCGKTQKRNI